MAQRSQTFFHAARRPMPPPVSSDDLRRASSVDEFDTFCPSQSTSPPTHAGGKTRESLIAAETSKKHAEERAEQLTRQLQGDEEKLAVYERRASGVNGVTPRTDEDMSRGQQLEAARGGESSPQERRKNTTIVESDICIDTNTAHVVAGHDVHRQTHSNQSIRASPLTHTVDGGEGETARAERR
ncbi:hypothetical protein BN946_scf184975.g15 [Trametes cinnabarina]|uniref:Uncharacterized protein n=1 Tax=Pycnoporus cinnabarinus TaxID=5643 RepID=A0A060SRC1_PYCCI|nr:hypothetical protein BN946_scf184975.g15 [Trametes cinnabarina]